MVERKGVEVFSIIGVLILIMVAGLIVMFGLQSTSDSAMDSTDDTAAEAESKSSDVVSEAGDYLDEKLKEGEESDTPSLGGGGSGGDTGSSFAGFDGCTNA